jgi:hypothetical protein
MVLGKIWRKLKQLAAGLGRPSHKLEQSITKVLGFKPYIDRDLLEFLC